MYHSLARRLASHTDSTAVDEVAFAPGACVRLSPTKGDRHLTVFLDAGHGGVDPGAPGTTQSGATIYEADETLPVELDAAASLRDDGYTVVVSRTTNTTVVRPGPAEVSGGALTLQGAHDDVAARDQCADDAQAALLVGIYFDAGGSTANAGSLTAYDAVRPFSAQNQRFAQFLQSDVVAAMNRQGWAIPDDGVQTDVALGSCNDCSGGSVLGQEAAAYDHLMLLGPADPGFFTTPSTMPGALIEPLFLTDPFEATVAASSAGQQAIAAGIVQAVEQFLAPAPGTSTPTTRAGAAAGRR